MNVRVAARFTPALLILFPAVVSAQPLPPSSGDQVTFKAETNLVLVPVVVRDSKGNAVGNLRKEDFQLFDKGKPQVVATFAVEETSEQVAQDRSLPDANTAPANGGAANALDKAAMVIPEHYVALLFDDLHFKIGNPDPPPGYIGDAADMWYARDAARKMLKTLKPADRVSVFTSSGQVMLDFTADRARIEEALLKLRPGKPVLPTVANSGLAGRELEDQTQDAVKWCGNVVRRMSHLPGQRTLVFLSPGLLLQGTSWSAVGDTMSLIDQAIRSRVVVNSLDARGLSPTPLRIAGPFQEFQMRVTDGTGGTYIRDANDLNGAMERLAATPKYIYVLGFSPQGIKEDGSFHALTVKLVSGHKLDVQAPRGLHGARREGTGSQTEAAGLSGQGGCGPGRRGGDQGDRRGDWYRTRDEG
jgi:VWFA-related protein